MASSTLDLSQVTNGKLIKVLEKCDADLSAATNAVFDACERNDVPFRDILASLGDADPRGVRYSAASSAMDQAKCEARRRVGPVQFDMFSIYVTYLQNQGLRSKPRW